MVGPFGRQTAEVLAAAIISHVAYCSMKEWAFPQNRWQRTTLNSWFHETHVLAICKLVRNSLCMEELAIYTSTMFDPNMLIQELSSPCVMRQLTIVHMHGLGKPCQAQLQVGEFLLKSAVNLEKLLFVFHNKDQLAPTEELEFITKLSSFPRASTNAREQSKVFNSTKSRSPIEQHYSLVTDRLNQEFKNDVLDGEDCRRSLKSITIYNIANSSYMVLMAILLGSYSEAKV
ncbi:hypothetical protein Cgig2_014503 [Carnegiea gigantea]|uniref:FBD domain-containing protein n=1 Tax=Carnegiea gigantea TaxID=171969 RepID=A0A9Q1JYQ6_9CARY|nr:hypothetical protein Cgig2_014503 [Carnegiea gigantea]